MSGVTVKPASSQAEATEAFDLACAVFAEHSAAADYRSFKTLSWYDDPTYRPENILLARDRAGALVGALRLVPRVLYRGAQSFAVAGISSVCVAPDHRGNGYSNALMEAALAQSASRGFDIAVLIARRAADHYYTRFGFWGIASYNKASIRLDSQGARGGVIAIEPAQRSHADVYARAHLECYGQAFGRFERTRAYWDFLLERSARVPQVRWVTLTADGTPIGYAVATADSVLEIAWLGEIDVAWLATAVAEALDPPGSDTLQVELPRDHRFFAAASGCDVTLSARECSYGGHMAGILDVDAVRSRLETRIADRLTRLGVDAYEDTIDGLNVYYDRGQCRVEVLPLARTPTYAQTHRLLGSTALSLAPWTLDDALPFNISYPDQL